MAVTSWFCEKTQSAECNSQMVRDETRQGPRPSFWCWDECHNPLRAAAESLMGHSSAKIGCNSGFSIDYPSHVRWDSLGENHKVPKNGLNKKKVAHCAEFGEILQPLSGGCGSRLSFSFIKKVKVLRRQCCLGGGSELRTILIYDSDWASCYNVPNFPPVQVWFE